MNQNIKRRLGLWESFDNIKGLHHGCRCLLEDRAGNIWLGSWENGISLYDGKRFVNLTTQDGLVGNNVNCMYQDRDGKTWIGTASGISVYDGERFVNFSAKDGLASNNVSCIHQDRKGYIWIGTGNWIGDLGNGISVYDGERFVNFSTKDGLAGNDISCIHQSREGSIWIGTGNWIGDLGNGISLYAGKRFVNLTTKNGLASANICCFLQDREGNIWVGTNNGLSKYDGRRFINFTKRDGLASDNVRCLLQDQEGNIWVGSEGDGVSCYDGQEFVTFSTEHGLASNRIFDIIQDRESSIWFACSQGGVSRYNPYAIISISDESVNEIMIQNRNGGVWWVSGDTVSEFDGKDINHYYSFEHEIFELFEDSKGRIWLGTDGGGVFICDNIQDTSRDSRDSKLETRNLTVDDGLVDNRILKIYEDIEGNIWFGTWRGLSKYDGTKFTNFTTADGLGSNIVSVIFQERKGLLWFGGWIGGGISSYDGKSFRRYTTNDGLANNRVSCIMEDGKGYLWIGTADGISYYNRTVFKNYTAQDGLLGSQVHNIFQDSRGEVWIAALGGGANRFDGRNFQALTTDDGLPSNFVSGITEDADGNMIVATYKGVCKYVPDLKTPPLIHLEEVDADKIYQNPEEIQLSESVATDIRIRYHGISFKTKRMRYNYILEGYDEDWKATWDEEVRYENLPVGEYSFRVTAINRDLVYSEKPAALKLRVIADPRDQVISDLEREVRRRTHELEEANKSLRQSEERFRLLAEHAPDIIFRYWLRPTLRAEYLSPSITAITGYTPEEFYSDSELSFKVVHPDDLPLLKSFFEHPEDIFRGPFALRLIHKDGRIVWVEQLNVPFYDETGELVAVEGVSRDITERKWMEQKLSESEEQYRLLFDNSPYPMMVFDRETFNFLAVNDSAIHHYGYSQEEFLAMSLKDIVSAKDSSELFNHISKLIVIDEKHGGNGDTAGAGLGSAGIWKHRKKDGNLIDVEIKWSPISFNGRKATLILANDITELRRSEKLLTLGQLAASVAHEVGNPLTAIKMRIYALAKESIISKQQEEDIRVISQELDRLEKTIQNFLSFVKPSQLEFKLIPISEPIEFALRILQPRLEQQNIRAHSSYDSKLLVIEADQLQLQELFLNLFINAIDAMPAGGELKVVTSLVYINNMIDYIQIEVVDSGEGIDEETLARIFEPFFTTKSRGYGLGLSIVERIASLHNGQVKVESQKGKGTKFTLVFPRSQKRM